MFHSMWKVFSFLKSGAVHRPLQVRTLFVSGLPMDVKLREVYLLFRPYEVSYKPLSLLPLLLPFCSPSPLLPFPSPSSLSAPPFSLTLLPLPSSLFPPPSSLLPLPSSLFPPPSPLLPLLSASGFNYLIYKYLHRYCYRSLSLGV